MTISLPYHRERLFHHSQITAKARRPEKCMGEERMAAASMEKKEA
jgi:hypothetical protein